MNTEKLELWKLAIDTQMHFNDLIMKLRAIVTSIITAIFGAAAISLSQSTIKIIIFNKNIPISVLIIAVGIFLLIAYFVLDLGYYFRLLLGSVKCSEDIEKEYPELTLTTSIKKTVTAKRAYTCLITYYLITFLISVIIAFLIYSSTQT